ncbi:hypothetical protein BC829DRAFT_387433, partial [Chytridium lagenaria]
MPPRYQPLSVDQSGATYRPSNSTSGLSPGVSSMRSSSRSAFYCSCVPAFFGDAWDRLSHRLPERTQVVGYISGALFAMGWWAFIDGVTYSSSREPALPNAIRFEDWLPGILSTISLIIVNLINKDTLTADDFSYSGSNIACKARAAAFYWRDYGSWCYWGCFGYSQSQIYYSWTYWRCFLFRHLSHRSESAHFRWIHDSLVWKELCRKRFQQHCDL